MLLLLPLLSDISPKKPPKNDEIQDHDLLLQYHSIDSRSGNIKKCELKTRRNGNDDILSNTGSISQNRIMIVDD
jgi:hypothetical protein